MKRNHAFRSRRLIVAVLSLLLIGVPPAASTHPLFAQQALDEDLLDLPAMTLTPTDLADAGLRRFRLNFGQLHTLEDVAAGMAEEQDVSEREARDMLDDLGFLLWYENGLYLRPDEDDPQSDVTVVVRSYILQFEDEDGAADAWDLLEDESADDTAEDVRRVEEFGDESEATRYREGSTEAIDLSFRLGNLHAGVVLGDLTGDEPALEDVESLAAALLERIETVLDEGGPGLSLQALRLAGEDVVASVDNYILIDGEAIQFYYESRADRRDREDSAEENGLTDDYDVWQLLSPLGDGQEDDVWYFVSVKRFEDDDAAEDWLAGIDERVGDDDRYADYDVDDDAQSFGDESVTYTVNQAERPITYRNMLVRVGDTVAEISLQGPETPGLETIEELADLQAECLEASSCSEIADVPDAVTAYIADLSEPGSEDDRDGDNGDDASPEAASVYRGGPAHTGEQPGPGPEGELRVRWELELPPTEEYVTHPVSPSLQDGVLYVLRYDGLHAIDAESGQALWLVEADANMDTTPVVDGDSVYFTAYGGIFALDASNGDVLWHIGEQASNEVDPAVSEERLYVLMQNGDLVALDSKSGEEFWRMNVGTRATPTVVDGVVYVGGYISDEGYGFWALDAENGEVLWFFAIETWFGSAPAVTGGVIYAGGANGTLYALDAETGDELWTYAGEPIDWGSGRLMVPAIAKDVVYYSSVDGNFVALEAASGDIIWEKNIGDYALFPVVADGAVYLFPSSSLLVLDAATGEERATLDQLGSIESGGGGFFSGSEFIRTSPLVVDGVVYVVLENGVLAIEGDE